MSNMFDPWISVKERLPKPYTEVFTYRRSVCGLGGYMAIQHVALGYGDAPMWSGDNASWKTETTHWTPLPTPPKEDKDDPD